MKCEDINLMISEYLDDELPKEKEGYLFTHFSTCSECREEFKQQIRIQNEIILNRKKVPEHLESRVLYSIEKKNTDIIKKHLAGLPATLSYVLAIVVVIIAIFSFYQIQSLKTDLGNFQERYESAIERIEFQNHQMNLMMSNMPSVQISGNPEEL